MQKLQIEQDQNSNVLTWGREDLNNNFELRKPQNFSDRNENLRLFITLRKESQSNIEYQKLTIMTPTNYKISMLKRLIEKEFADLFPHEPTFICAKLEDQHGYSLSNTSYVNELLKHGDRLFAIPEIFTKDLIGKMHVTHDLNELTFMLKSIQQTIIAKLSEANLGSPETQMDILQLVVPIGFTLQQKAINHNTGLTLKKIFENERLLFFEEPQFALIFNLFVKMISFWVNDLIFQDSFLLNLSVDILDIVTKSSKFCLAFKNQQTLNSLMSVSKLDFVSAQTRSRIIKLISHLSKNQFQNTFQPKSYDEPMDAMIPQSRGRRPPPPIPVNPVSRNTQLQFERDNEFYPTSNGFKRLNNQNNNLNNDVNNYVPSIMQNEQAQVRRPQSINTEVKFNPQNQLKHTNSREKQSNQPLKQPQFERYSLNEENSFQPIPHNSDKHLENTNTYKKNNRNNNQNLVFEGLVQDYINLLSSDSSEDMLIFAVQNLADGIEESIHSIMDNKQAYTKCMNLLELSVPFEYMPLHIRILQNIAKNMNESRARDGIKIKIIQRILKAFSYQPKDFQGVFYELLASHLQQSQFSTDVHTLIQMIESPYLKISHLGIKILAMISDPNRLNQSNLAVQFENYIRSLMEWTLDISKGEDFQYNSLLTLSNLSLNDIVRPQILHLKGIDFFIKILRESQRVDAQRSAAKALLNLSIKSRETKLTIVSELDQEILKAQRGDLDTVVTGYIQTLLGRGNDKKQMI